MSTVRTIFLTIAAALAALALAGGEARAQQRLSVGGEAAGSLRNGDQQLDSGEYVDVWTFQGRAGQQVTINMSSTQIDAYLMLRGPGGLSEWNDDRATGEANARITVRLPADGLYRISATSYEPGESGEYLISLVEGAGPASGREGGGDIQLGQTGAGRLALGDDRLDAGEFVDRWTFRGQPGQTYEVRLNSGAFDSYLLVRGTDLEADNDDEPGRGSVDSRLEFVMPADGEVRIYATSYQADETGEYALTLSRPGEDVGPAPVLTASASIAPGDSLSGSLGDGDATLRSGEYMRAYTLAGRAGDRLDVRMRSSGFDPYVFLTGPGEFSAANDDDESGEDGTNSRLIVTLPADGEYQLVATSFEPGETGDFILAVDRAGEEAAPTGASTTLAAFEDGVVRQGSLSLGDDTLDDGQFVDMYQFTGRRGTRIALTAESAAFDTNLFLLGPGDVSENNDDGPDGTNSRIDFVLPQDGTYDVAVSSYDGGETGPYRLTAGLSLGTPRQAGVPGGPRIFAVMVGISDYQGYSSNLPYTDEDAIKLAEDLRRDGLLNPASVVLTDADATVAGVKAAFAQVAAQAGPEDIFLFFYSGHGAQNRGVVSPFEPDGMTETIVMVDGQISDAEMGEMFASVDARLAMIVMDSCFSGGFARNVVTRPGIMGMFSSEEDLTSQVAGKFQAGGYLSHFLRTGLGGEANADGDDMITAGELTQYLRRRYAVDVADVRTQTIDGQRSYQNLVVERGGVQVDDVVVRVARG
ncbi:pre-peptidase C-terminal domain-containing protein [Brevundimonas sp.]|jgi:hypothetical protein|uniref:pre-peptidase C-terminal domain-containing protein n=1 Tax=Brevundimonas sp. TaxID=1871086 RepID=UPI002E1436AD|nr:pre-peptidase C-terminal domain-containing protein [Brevundimonas sp.]